MVSIVKVEGTLDRSTVVTVRVWLGSQESVTQALELEVLVRQYSTDYLSHPTRLCIPKKLVNHEELVSDCCSRPVAFDFWLC